MLLGQTCRYKYVPRKTSGSFTDDNHFNKMKAFLLAVQATGSIWAWKIVREAQDKEGHPLCSRAAKYLVGV